MSATTAPATAGFVTSWDTSVGVDGPGTRFVVFTGGCPLRCVYCANPETWTRRHAHRVTADQVLARAAGFAPFIRSSGGGITISGGEPLTQPAFVTELLAGAQERGLHTALDTSGVLGDDASEELLAATDLILLDVKSWDPATYRRVTGGDIAPTQRFAERLAAARRPTWVRFVLVPGWTDEPSNIDGVARFAAALGNVERVDVLPFHRMAAGKYRALGIPYPTERVRPPSTTAIERARQQFRDRGLDAY